MTYKFSHGSHSIYCLNYHLIQAIKYRKEILINDEVIDELKSRTLKIADIYGVKIISIETDKDHIHLLIECKPQTDIVKFVNNWKSGTSKALRNRFPEIKEQLWKGHLWSPSYCLITTGQTTIDMLIKYVESQGDK